MKDEIPKLGIYHENSRTGTRLRSELNDVLYGAEFDKAYQRYEDELAGIAYMLTGIKVNRKRYNEKRKDAARRLILDIMKAV